MAGFAQIFRALPAEVFSECSLIVTLSQVSQVSAPAGPLLYPAAGLAIARADTCNHDEGV